MSTNWIPQHPISFDSFAAFERNGVKAQSFDGDKVLVLTDGQNHLHVYPVLEQGTVLLERSGANDPVRILEAIEDAFDVVLVCEYDAEYGELAEQVLRE